MDSERLEWLLLQCGTAPDGARTGLVRVDGLAHLCGLWPDGRCTLRPTAAAPEEGAVLAASEAGGIEDGPGALVPNPGALVASTSPCRVPGPVRPGKLTALDESRRTVNAPPQADRGRRSADHRVVPPATL